MSTNPYTFIAVPRELRALSEELASLGGGDTRLGRVRVACLVGGDTPTRAVRKASPPSVWREELEETADQQDAECVCVRDRRRGAGYGEGVGIPRRAQRRRTCHRGSSAREEARGGGVVRR